MNFRQCFVAYFGWSLCLSLAHAAPKDRKTSFLFSSLQTPVSLAGAWRYHPGDDIRWATQAWDDSAWKVRKVPVAFRHNLVGPGNEVVWYRIRIHAPWHRGFAPKKNKRQLSLLVRLQPDVTYEVFANGERITPPTYPFSSSFYPFPRTQLLSIPSHRLKSQDLVLAFRVWRSPPMQKIEPLAIGISSGPILLGWQSHLRPHFALFKIKEKEDFSFSVVLSFLFFCVGLFHLYLFVRRREQTEYLWFGIFCLLFPYVGLLAHPLLAEALALDFRWTNSCLWMGVCCVRIVAMQFLLLLLGLPRRLNLLIRAYQITFLLLIPLYAFHELYPYLVRFGYLTNLPLALFVLGSMVYAIRQGNKEAKTLFFGLLLAFLAIVLRPLIPERVMGLNTGFLRMSFALMAVIVSMLLALTNRFLRLYFDIDRSNEELQRLDLLKDEFLANTSHELRTPLSGMIGLAESLLHPSSREDHQKVERHLQTIVSSGHRLSNLINDILDFSKLRHGGLQLEQKATPIGPIVAHVMELMQPLISQNSLAFHNQIEADTAQVYCDANRLQQIMINLLGNAIKFTEHGEIRVSAKVQEGMMRVAVHDTGIGIPEDKQERVFNSFEQGAGSIEREYGGTGLGLAVTRQLVEQHGGTIGLHSQVGEGSEFFFTLPLATDEPAPAATQEEALTTRAVSPAPPRQAPSQGGMASAAPEYSGLSLTTTPTPREDRRAAESLILVVDDEPINLQVLDDLLSQAGYKVALAGHGIEALQQIKDGLRPSLIILDVMMPQLSGYKVCEALRQQFTANELPILMLTAKTMTSDLMRGLELGANDYITKPFAKNELLARIQTHLALSQINISTARFVPRHFLQLLGKTSITDIRRGDYIQTEMTILFSDVRSYTSLVEQQPAYQSFLMINEYLNHMETAIQTQTGFIDSYIGDGILALFVGGSDLAIQAGVAMQKNLHTMNKDRQQKGLPLLSTGIGINTGEVILGVIGSHNRTKCGVVGDNVNLASRIENLTKHYQTPLLLGEKAYKRIESLEQHWFRPIDRVAVKGKSEPVTLYEALEALPAQQMEARHKTRDTFIEGLTHFWAGDFARAKVAFEAVLNHNPDDFIASLQLQRTMSFLEQGAPSDWSGVVSLHFK